MTTTVLRALAGLLVIAAIALAALSGTGFGSLGAHLSHPSADHGGSTCCGQGGSD